MTVSIPEDASERDERRVRQAAERAKRNAEIREAYPTLRDEHGRDEALEILAERHACSPATVREVLYGRR